MRPHYQSATDQWRQEAFQRLAYANCNYINAKNSEKPRVNDMDSGKTTDRSEVYSGCYARVKISFYAFNRSIAYALMGVRKVANGTTLGGSICMADDLSDGMMTSSSKHPICAASGQN